MEVQSLTWSVTGVASPLDSRGREERRPRYCPRNVHCKAATTNQLRFFTSTLGGPLTFLGVIRNIPEKIKGGGSLERKSRPHLCFSTSFIPLFSFSYFIYKAIHIHYILLKFPPQLVYCRASSLRYPL